MLRRLAAEFMLNHEEDFLPFLTDTVTGDTYTSGMEKLVYIPSITVIGIQQQKKVSQSRVASEINSCKFS